MVLPQDEKERENAEKKQEAILRHYEDLGKPKTLKKSDWSTHYEVYTCDTSYQA